MRLASVVRLRLRLEASFADGGVVGSVVVTNVGGVSLAGDGVAGDIVSAADIQSFVCLDRRSQRQLALEQLNITFEK